MEAKIPLSVFLIVKDEERNIEACLKSADFADEIIVVDTGSVDKTAEKAKQFTQKVYSYPWQGFGRMKEIAKNLCANKWVFTMDADEKISEGLKSYLQTIFQNNTADNYDAYMFSTKIFFKNKWRKCLGPYPGYKIRMFNKDKGKFSLKEVFEDVEITGRTAKVQKDILHYQYEDEYDYFEKMEKYSALAAYEINKTIQAALYKTNFLTKGKHRGIFKISYSNFLKLINFLKMFLSPPHKFIKKYFLYKACFEGKDGLILSFGHMYYTFLKYFKTFKIKSKDDLFPLSPQKVKNAIIRMPNWLGDIIMALPVFESFNNYFDNTHIIVPEKYADFFKLISYKGKIITDTGNNVTEFIKHENKNKETKINAAVLFTNSFSSAYKIYKTRVPAYGYNTDARRLILKNAVHLNKKYKNKHMIEFYGNLYNRITFKRYTTVFPRPLLNEKLIADYKKEYPENLVGLSLCANYGKTKIYDLNSAIKLVKLLKQKNQTLNFALVGTQNEKDYYNEIEKNAGFKIYNLAGQFTVYELAHFLKILKYIITTDSGAMHLAAFMDVPGAALFFSTSPEHTRPLNDKIAVLKSDISCSPCFKKECRFKHYNCVSAISPETIAEELLKKML